MENLLIWEIRPEMKSEHPAPFPLIVPARIIISILKEKGIVFDPYCGSGSVLVAAKLLGHDYFGIEISETYVNMVRERLTLCEQEKPIIDKESSFHIIKKTYKDRKDEGMWDHKIKKKQKEMDNIPSPISDDVETD